METPKTAEEILEGSSKLQDVASFFNVSFKRGLYNEIVFLMNEYGNQCAEQARREVADLLHVEIHNQITQIRVDLYKVLSNEIVDRKLYDLDIFVGKKVYEL